MTRKTKYLRPSALTLAIGMAFSAAVWAQSADGSLYGRAKSGATVTITAVDTGVSRQIKADADGTFNFSKLPPGRYKVTSGAVTREVSVAIGSGSSVDFEDSQRIEVTGSRIRAGIDTSSVESNSVFTQEAIRALPVQRSVDAVALLAPGTVKGDDFGDDLTLPSFGGASIAENGYYINGLDVTNIRNFLSYAELPFDAISQQQVKTGGYGAEYGRSLGGVVSIATKRGTNEWKGGGAIYWEPKSLRSKGRDVLDKEPERLPPNTPYPYPFVFNSADELESRSLVVYGGGPLIKDKLFVFASLEAPNDTRSTFDQSSSEKRKNSQANGLLKIDWAITDSHLMEFTAITNKTKYTYDDFTSATAYSSSHDGAGDRSEADGGGNVYIAKYTGYLTDDLTVSALVGRVNDKRLKFTGARQEGLDCPVVLENDFSEVGCWTGPWPGVGAPDAAAPRDEDKRNSVRFDLEYALGKHTIRAGIDNQAFESSEAGGSSYTGGAYWLYRVVGANGEINGQPGFAPGSLFARKRTLQSTTGTYEVNNKAFYLEDSWRVSKNWLLYGGLRWESFENLNGEGVPFVKKDNLRAPRLGFSWDVNGDSSLKVFGNAGRYYIPVASNTNIRSTRGELFVHTFYTYTGRDPRTQEPTGLTEVNQVILSDGRLANPGTIADTQLKPMNQDEFILGFQQALNKQFVYGVKGTYRTINAGMDDYCDHTRIAAWITANINPNFVDNLAGCMLMNPGENLNIQVDLNDDGNLSPVTVPASALGLAPYKRDYKSLEFTFERPWDGRWSLQGSYTWSKSTGTAEGYVQSNLNQEDAGVTQDFDFGSFSDGADGYLPNDRRHVIKLFGNYQVADEWRLGGNLTIASGRPLSCIGFVPRSVPDYAGAAAYTSASSYYCIKDPNQAAVLVPRGSVGRTDWTQTLDLSISYEPLWAQKKLTLQASVFNVLNSDKPTELREVRDYSRDESNATTFPIRQSLNYGSPTSFQTPRYVRLTARYEF